MKYEEKNKIFRSRRWELIRVTAVFLFALASLIIIVNVMGRFYNRQNIQILKQNVQKAAVECYSVEGIYPPDIDYLVDNYSLSYNGDKYYVFYETFASNVMPTIEVYERK